MSSYLDLYEQVETLSENREQAFVAYDVETRTEVCQASATKERWRVISGTKGQYFVSDLGNIWSTRRERFLKAGAALGYRRVTLFGRARQVHALVLEAFVSVRPRGLVARHKNSNKLDNRLTNLEWSTSSENTLDMWIDRDPAMHWRYEERGLKEKRRGPLSDQILNGIRSHIAAGRSLRSVAREYEIPLTTVHRIKHQYTYRLS